MLPMHYYLKQVIPHDSDGPSPVEPIEIHITQDEVQVGRRKIISLAQFPQISRDHAVFYKSDNGTLFVKDLNSLNGVFVNDVRIGSTLKVVKSGDVIGFGVTSSAPTEGFVCVLCAEARVKPEVIEISDEEELVDSGNSNLQIPILEKRAESKFHNENENTCDNGNDNSSGSHEIRNTSKSQNDIKGIQNENCCKVEGKSPENIPIKTENIPIKTENFPIKTCIIPVVRCDAKDFQHPSDVKSPCRIKFEQEKLPLNRKRKRVRKLSSDSSGDSSKDLHPNASSKENMHADLIFSNKDDSGCSNSSANQASCRKRKLSNISGPEVSHNLQSASKKTEFHDRITDSLEPEAKSSHKHQDNDGNYSQIEDIIYISDDELYLDFKSSQDYVHIKQEPEEMEDYDNEADIYKEIFERESNYEEECLPCESKANVCTRQNQDSDDRVESIESIRAYVSNLDEKDSKPVKSDSSSGTSVQINGSIFPLPSQDSISESSSDGSSDSMENVNEEMLDYQSTVHKSTEENHVSNISLAENKCSKKSAGKILLIDPKPMPYRPRRLRGRDEGFVEKKKPFDQPAAVKPLSHISYYSTPKERRKTVAENENPNSELRKSKNLGNSKHKAPVSQIQRNEKHSNHSDTASTSKKNQSSCQKNDYAKKTQPEMGVLTNGMESNTLPANVIKSEFHRNVNVNRSNSSQHSDVSNVSVPGGNKHFTNNNAQRSVAAIPTSMNKLLKYSNTEKVTAKYTNPSPNNPSEASRGSQTDVTRKTVLSPKSDSLFAKISFNGVMKTLLQMNTKWLQEQSTLKIPPSAISKGATDLPLSYKSYDFYASSFYPMILLEIWEYMYTESKEVNASNKQYKKFYFSILTYTSREDCIELKCESVVNERVCFGPREGVIVVLELKENLHKCSPLFGYIFKHKIEPLNLGSLKLSHWKNLPEEWLKNAKRWTFYAYIKKKDMSFQLNSLMKGNGLCYIRSKLRLADALRFVQDSPLLKDILTPRESTFAADHFVSSPRRQYNSSQTEVIKRINDEINRPHLQPKIILLQGLPGTGKTHVIIGLLERLFYYSKNKSNLKILVTAPSNESIDEIGCRLIELDKQSCLRANKIKLVRVGLEKQIHPKMLPYFVDRKAKELYQQSSQLANFKENEGQKLLSEINKLEMEPLNKDKCGRIKYLRDQYKQLMNPSSVKIDYYTEMVYKINVLQESQIILSTLNSCGLSLFHRSFNSNSNIYFSCCIIDDANQSTELEVLQPLMLGIRKLVLVGDHEQLPAPVHSKLAAQYGLTRSMFERFHLYFQSLNKTPVHTLTEQFRMHSAICEFPSKHFYAGRLLTHPATSLRYKEFPLNPYILLDISIPAESTDQLSKNEASIMSYICKYVVGLTDSQSSIGIIVSHQAKRYFYMKVFHHHSFSKQIEIYTVDGFQGREKDVIILSALDANNHTEGASFLSCKKQLNVAITRAKKCLIICANTAELIDYPYWKALILDAQERKLCIALSSPRLVRNVLENCIKKKM